MELSNLSIIAISLGLCLILCLFVGCMIMKRRCCPFWVSEKLGRFRERIYQSELQNYSKSPSLFSCNNMNNRSTPTHSINIPIVIVSDENGKRVMAGKETCVYEKQDLEEVL